MKKRNRAGFTLIELLTVIAIIGILAGIIIPTVSMVKVNANKTRSKIMLGQWVTSMGLFKNEYGYYPQIASGNKVDPELFFGALTGKTYSGGTADAGKLAGNTKKLSFYSAADAEVTSTAAGDTVNGSLKDAFGNTEFACFIDSNNDGIVNNQDTPALSAQTVTAVENGKAWAPPSTALNLSTGVRAGVIFYSAGRGASASDMVYSW